MKQRRLIAIIPVAILIAGPWVVPRIGSLSAINRYDSQINIKTGQVRHARYLWYIRVSERVEDTILSTTLEGESVGAADITPWRTASTYSPGWNGSVHCKFGGVFLQMADIEFFFKTVEPDVRRKKQIVRDLLRLWQATGSYFGAKPYLRALSEEVGSILEKKYPGFFPKPNPSAAKEEDALSDHKYQQALECYRLLHEQPEPETYWSRLLKKEWERSLSEAEEQRLRELITFARAFDWELEEAPDPIVAGGDRQEVEAVVTRICRDPTLRSAYGLPDPGSWDRLTVHFFHGNRCHVEMFFNAGFAYPIHLFKYQGKWEVLLIGYLMID